MSLAAYVAPRMMQPEVWSLMAPRYAANSKLTATLSKFLPAFSRTSAGVPSLVR